MLDQENPYVRAPIHREEQFRDSNLVNSETFEESSLWKPFATQRDAYAALELESFVKKKLNGIYQLESGGNQGRVVRTGAGRAVGGAPPKPATSSVRVAPVTKSKGGGWCVLVDSP